MAAVSGGIVCALGLGRDSLQGDAKFCTLLETMGCKVNQVDSSTTVTGPSVGTLQSASIDMANMTDAFMTAAVVGAVASGVTQLTGISNQRVKECNRIAVMVNELKKIGIPSGELEDRMWIEGIGDWSSEKRKKLLRKSFVSCRNDHRIAMSFAVLGCTLDRIVITDKECTEKTYPSFWEDCRNKLGLTIQAHFETERLRPPSVIIIGMRGCGKTFLGRRASHTFKLKFVDMDALLEDQFQQSLSTYIGKFGWEKFRHEESQLLQRLMTTETNGSIICCGGGVVESVSCRSILRNYPHVVYIERDLDSIISNLKRESNSPRRALLPESIDKVYNRRIPFYESCGNFKFVAQSAYADIEVLCDKFEKFLKNVFPFIGIP